jgi:hypothetical protein
VLDRVPGFKGSILEEREREREREREKGDLRMVSQNFPFLVLAQSERTSKKSERRILTCKNGTDTKF